MSSSQQLVRKLLKATSDDALGTPKQPHSSQKKRQRLISDRSIDATKRKKVALSEDELIDWQTKLILATDRTMSLTAPNVRQKNKKSSVSYFNAYNKVLLGHEQELQKKHPSLNCDASGAARSSSYYKSHSFQQIPTYNKQQHIKKRQEKKQMKLIKAISHVNHSMTKSINAKKKQSIKSKITK